MLRLQALPAGRHPPHIYREVRIRHVIRIGLQMPGATPVPGCELREHGQQHSQRAGQWLCVVLGEPAASFDRRQDGAALPRPAHARLALTLPAHPSTPAHSPLPTASAR